VKKQDGKWKVELSDLGVGAFVFNNMAMANEETIPEVEAGQHPSADDAWKAATAKASARSGAPGGGGGGGGGGGAK
jgi:uncharacterized membrane protein